MKTTIRALPETGFMRLNEVLRLIPVGRSTWWAKVKQGEFPPPYRLGPRTTVWRCEDIRALIDRINSRGETRPGAG